MGELAPPRTLASTTSRSAYDVSISSRLLRYRFQLGLLAAGFECGVIHEALAALAALPYSKRVATQKVVISSISLLLEALPTRLLDQRSLGQAAKLLLGRATDAEADIGSRCMRACVCACTSRHAVARIAGLGHPVHIK